MPEFDKPPYSYQIDKAVPKFDDSKPLFVFDGVCVLCSGGASWIMKFDRSARVNFASAQGDLGRALYRHYGRAIDDSYLFLVKGRAYEASRGYFELCKVLGGLWQLLRVFEIVPEPLRDWVYRQIAANRYRWFGKVGYCDLLKPEQKARLI